MQEKIKIENIWQKWEQPTTIDDLMKLITDEAKYIKELCGKFNEHKPLDAKDISRPLNIELCKKCIHGNENGDCITKEELPFDSFICRQNEYFELYKA